VLLTNITDLNLNRMITIGDEALSHLTNLKKLALGDNEIQARNKPKNSLLSDESLMQLTNLTDLELFSCDKFTDNGLSLLTNLKRLYMNDYSIIHDSSLALLTNITDLSVFYNNQITTNGLSLLITNLKSLYLEGCNNIPHNFPLLLTNTTNKNPEYNFVRVKSMFSDCRMTFVEQSLYYVHGILAIKMIEDKQDVIILLKSAYAKELLGGLRYRGVTYATEQEESRPRI
jgi:hypothetical protein